MSELIAICIFLYVRRKSSRSDFFRNKNALKITILKIYLKKETNHFSNNIKSKTIKIPLFSANWDSAKWTRQIGNRQNGIRQTGTKSHTYMYIHYITISRRSLGFSCYKHENRSQHMYVSTERDQQRVYQIKTT